MKKVIANLLEGDVIHLVVYDTNVDVIFDNRTAREKETLISMVNELVTADCTNLCGGIQKAFEVLKSSNTVLHLNRLYPSLTTIKGVEQTNLSFL